MRHDGPSRRHSPYLVKTLQTARGRNGLAGRHDCHRCQGHQPHRGDRGRRRPVRRTGARTVVPDLHAMGVRRPGRADGPHRPSDRDIHRGRRPLGTGCGPEYPGTAQHRARWISTRCCGTVIAVWSCSTNSATTGAAAGDVLADRGRGGQRRLPDGRAIPVGRRATGGGARAVDRGLVPHLGAGPDRVPHRRLRPRRRPARAGRRLAIEQSNKSAEEYAEVGLGLSARRQGRLDDAEAHLTKWLDWLSQVGGTPGIAFILAQLGFVAEQRGDFTKAQAAPTGLRGSAAGRRRAGDRAGPGGSGRRGRGSGPRPPATRRSRSAPGESGCTTSAGGRFDVDRIRARLQT